MQDQKLTIIPLGGLGEFGMNILALRYGDDIVVIDAGMMFPEAELLGVDVVIPDISYLLENSEKVRAIVLTHGHEDHISALGYLLRERADIPVIGSALTLAFAKGKLRDHRINPITIEVKEGQRRKVDPFELEFVAVNHSIPDALAVVIRTPAGVVLHTGDFKMDQLPLDGRTTDLARFAALGNKGVDLFMVDSTNADIPGFTTSEREIMPVLDRVIAASKRRIIVASFASHVHRVQQVIDIAFQHNRKVAFIGRSMVRNMSLASEMGYLHIPPNTLVDEDEIDAIGDLVVLICTGSQGEPLAALSRMANGDHRIRVGDGDTVILASSLIPGNENAVY